MIVKRVFLILIFPVMLQAAEHKDAIETWVFSISSPEVSKNKVAPFFDYLSNKTQHSFRVTNSTNIADLKNNCFTGKPSLIVVGSATANFLVKKCRYSMLTTSLLEVVLYGRMSVNIVKLEEIHTIGFIKDSKLADVANTALLKEGLSFKSIYYSNFLEVVQNSNKDNLDAVVLTPGVSKGTAYFSKKWKPIFKFKEKSSVNVIASPLITASLKTKITDIFLSNSKIVEKVWQNEIGLGPFLQVRP